MLTAAIFAALLGLASASPLRGRSLYAVKETHPVPSQWTKVAPAPGNHMIQLQIGLKQSQFDELERHLYEGISECPYPTFIELTILTLHSLGSSASSLWTTPD
jgi:hypothetical protein